MSTSSSPTTTLTGVDMKQPYSPRLGALAARCWA
jgi:hypothetical protein